MPLGKKIFVRYFELQYYMLTYYTDLSLTSYFQTFEFSLPSSQPLPSSFKTFFVHMDNLQYLQKL